MNKRISIGIVLGLDGLLGLKGVLDIKSWCADGAAMDSDRLDSPQGDDEWAAWALDPATGEEIPLYTRSEVDAFTARPTRSRLTR